MLNGTGPKNRACWFVDMGYVVGASERFKLDYVKAEALLIEAFGPVQTYLFNGFDPQYGITPGLKGFYDAMRAHGMVVRLYPMSSGNGPGDNRQRGVDVDIGSHMVWQASRGEIETLILTSGDRDLVPAVEIVREEFNKPVMLFTYPRSVSRDLVAISTDWWKFDQYEERLARPKRTGNLPPLESIEEPPSAL